VLSGAGMMVVNTPAELETYLSLASTIETGKEQRVVISKVKSENATIFPNENDAIYL